MTVTVYHNWTRGTLSQLAGRDLVTCGEGHGWGDTDVIRFLNII